MYHGSMATLLGSYIRLEPLTHAHAGALLTAAAEDRSFYQWTLVPEDAAGMTRYIDTAVSWREAGTAVPFAIVRQADGVVLGSTRLWDIERWLWPAGHVRHGRKTPDGCEIGHTWLSRSGIRTAANTEAKLLMMTYAFETWDVLRVCLHTDARNQRSRAAIERIGGKYEGTLRSHRMAADFTPRNSARYSILAEEWPEVKERLERMRQR